jgi:hypothetical protein
MASQGPNSPGTMADDATVGTQAWSNPDNAKISDNVYAKITNFNAFANYLDNSIKIIKSDGTFGTTNKATTNLWPTSDTYISYGSSIDLWGETWTAEDINDADFGVVLSSKDDYEVKSHYLKATNFGFSIPTGATIDGILVEAEEYANAYTGGAGVTYIDHIRITVYYTEAATGTNCQVNIGDTWKEVSAMKINIGDAWKEVASAKINIGDNWKDIF